MEENEESVADQWNGYTEGVPPTSSAIDAAQEADELRWALDARGKIPVLENAVHALVYEMTALRLLLHERLPLPRDAARAQEGE